MTAPSVPLPFRATRRGAAFRNPNVRFGLGVLAVLAALALLAPVIAPYDPAETNPRRALEGPSSEYLLGTDNLGRDTLSRIIWGGRWSLGLAVIVVGITMTVGTIVGLVAAMAGGWVDDLIMRAVDVLLAFPSLVLTLAIVGTLGQGSLNAVLGLAVIGWADTARVIRSAALGVRGGDYVRAGEAIGCSGWRILFRYLLPAVLPVVIVLATTGFGGVVLSLSALGFLGLGAQPPTPEWGTMLDAGRLYFLQTPQLMLFPGIAVTVTAIAANLAGDGLRDLIEPGLR